MNETRIIKRYSNRKLYDTEKSCYVTLGEVLRLVNEEKALVQVIDNKTKTDITSRVLPVAVLTNESVCNALTNFFNSSKDNPLQELTMLLGAASTQTITTTGGTNE